MRVREARGDDLDRLLELYRLLEGPYADTVVRDPENDEAEHLFARVLSDEHQTTLVAEEDGEAVVGTLVVAVLPSLAHGGAPYAVVENVVVDEEARGRGVGAALARAAMDGAREAGAYKLALTTNAKREDAHRFYRELGFRETHLGFEVAL